MELEPSEALLMAAGAGDVREVRDLLARGAFADTPSRRPLTTKDGKEIPVGRTALHEAARAGHIDVLRILCAEPYVDVNVRALIPDGDTERYGPSPLDVSAASNRVDAIRFLLERGAKQPEKALIAALGAKVDTSDAVRVLLETDATASCRHVISSLAAVLVAHVGSLGTLQAILAATPAGERRKEAAGCAFGAALSESGAVVRVLAAEGMPVDGETHKAGYTALGLAALSGKLEAVTAFVELGARLSGIEKAGGKDGPAPDVICWAAEGGHVPVIRYLLSRGASLEARDAEGYTPILKAAACGHGPAVVALAEAGADPTARSTGPMGAPLEGGEPSKGLADFAAALSYPPVLRLLRARGIPYDLSTKSGAFDRSAPPRDTEFWMFFQGWRERRRTPLGWTAHRGDAEAVRELLAAGADPSEPALVLRFGDEGKVVSQEGARPLYEAAAGGFPEVVRLLVQAGADPEARQQDSGGGPSASASGALSFRPLEKAIASGKVEAARALLELGCGVTDDAYAPAAEGAEPRAAALPLACEIGNLDLVRALLARGASPASKHGHSATPYAIAARGGRADILRALVEREAPSRDVVESVAAGAARAGAVDCLRVALDLGADLRRRFVEEDAAQSAHGRGPKPFVTLLLRAAAGGHLECVRELLGRGADPREVEGVPPPPPKDEGGGPKPQQPPEFVLSGRSALECAAAGGHAGVVRLLASRGAPVDRPGSGRDSALGLAAAGRHKETVRALLECGADPARPEAKYTFRGDEWCPALHVAAQKSDLHTLRVLLDAGAPVDQSDSKNRTPLMRPLVSSDGSDPTGLLPTVQELLRRGADPFHGSKPTDGSGDFMDLCILHQVSCGMTRLEVLVAMEEAGFRVPRQSAAMASAILFAFSKGAFATARWYLERGVDTSLAYLSGEERADLLKERPLLHALLVHATGKQADDFLACLRLVLDNGAGVNASFRGSTPLHLAAGNAAAGLEALRVLLERGADVQARGKGGRTPLLVAVSGAGKDEERLPFVRALLDAGADVGARDEAGRSAAAEAAEAHSLPLFRLLMERGAARHVQEGEILAAASRPRESNRSRDEKAIADARNFLAAVLEDELREVEAEGYAWPEVARDAEGGLAGRARGYSMALRAALDDDSGSAAAADDARQWADLLLCLRGPLRPSELHLKLVADEDGPRAAALAAAARVLRLEGRAAPEAAAEEEKPSRAAGRSDRKAEGEAQKDEDPAEEAADAADGETALHAACRAGLRLTALRLARAVPPDAVDAADAAEETALSRAVAFGPPLFDVCALLIQKGADLGRQIGSGEGGRQRVVLDATRDAAYRARLKRAATSRDAFISYGHHPPEVARFTARLRDRFQAEQVSCWMDEMKATGIEAGTEWREQIGVGIRAARVVVFIASKHSCASDWCMLELSRARDLGRPVFPVWAEAPFPLDERASGLLRGCRFLDLSSPALLEAGFPPLLADVRRAVEGAAAADPAASEDPARVRPAPPLPARLAGSKPKFTCWQALLAMPGARCAVRPGSFLALWCAPEAAPHAAAVLAALAFRGVPCWLDCPLPGDSAETRAAADAALAACAAFVPLLSPAPSAHDDRLLAERIRRARAAHRPVRSVLLSGLHVPPALEYSLARTPKFPFFPEDPDSFFPCLNVLLAEAGGPAPAAPPKLEGPPALHAPATAASPEESARAAALQAEIAARDRELEQLEGRVAELEAAAARGSKKGKKKGGTRPKGTPPPDPPLLLAPGPGPAGASGSHGAAPPGSHRDREDRSKSCALM
eukprot:tig00000158_g10181.t1